MSGDARDPGYFDRLYADNPDPWRFETSDYERDKYAATLAALPRPHYARAIEIGCSIGVLTERLAGRCDDLLGTDVAQAALDQATRRCAAQPQVHFARLAIPGELPEGSFDLVMLSEILYYFDAVTLTRVADAVIGFTRAGGDLVLVHWLGPTPDYPMTGDEAVTAFEAAAGDRLMVMQQSRTADYRLDVFRDVRAS